MKVAFTDSEIKALQSQGYVQQYLGIEGLVGSLTWTPVIPGWWDIGRSTYIKAPYRNGVAWVQEAAALVDGVVVYRADGALAPKWRSQRGMPRSWSRWKVNVTIEPKPAYDVVTVWDPEPLPWGWWVTFRRIA